MEAITLALALSIKASCICMFEIGGVSWLLVSSLKPLKDCIGLTLHVLHDPYILFILTIGSIESHPQFGQGGGDLIEDVMNSNTITFRKLKMFSVGTSVPFGL